MAERLLSVGLDVGTTTTQLILSRLTVENQASSFTVPEMVIGQREVIYRSPVHFTPLLGKDRVDGEKIRQIVAAEYDRAGIRRQDVDTGAIIITGETSRKENAGAVLKALEGFAGDFVAATAGPDLESILAARGAGAVEFSAATGKTVLHMDIGGGTSNLALIRDGRIEKTGCLNVGGRLVKFGENKEITYVSPVLEGLCDLQVGDRITEDGAKALSGTLVQALEMAAGLRERTGLLEKLWTAEAGAVWASVPDGCVISFSGGVADCIENVQDWCVYGDFGPVLGQKIRESFLCRGEYRLGSETVRATVVGAGCHSMQLSGSTVFVRNVQLPQKNLPVVCLTAAEQELDEAGLARRIRELLRRQDREAVLALPGFISPEYGWLKRLGRGIVRGFAGKPILVTVEQDCAKALGQLMALEAPGQDVLCLDRVRLSEGSYLDIGVPVGPALPVVVKTLILEEK